MRPVLELLWYSQQAFHIAIGTAAAKRPCIWPSIHPCRTPPYPLRSRSAELRFSYACAFLISRLGAGHQAVAVLRPAGPAIPHGQLDLPQLAEVIQVPSRRDAADPGLVRNRACR